MGRARGTKRTAQPAPGRGAWPPELQDLQERGGMAPDWHDTWHGRGGGVSDLDNSAKIFSAVFPNLENDDYHSLRKNPWGPQEIFAVIDNMDRSKIDDLSILDPFVRSLWENEKLRLRSFADKYNLNLDWDDLGKEWRRRFVGSLFHITERNFSSPAASYSLLGMMMHPSGADDKMEKAAQIEKALVSFAADDPNEFGRFARQNLLATFNEARKGRETIYLSKDLFLAIQSAWNQFADPPGEQQLDEMLDNWKISETGRERFRADYLETYARRFYNDISYGGALTEDIEDSRCLLAFKQALATVVRDHVKSFADRPDFHECMIRIIGKEWRKYAKATDSETRAEEVSEALCSSISSSDVDFQEALAGEISFRDWVLRVLEENF